MTVTAVNSYRPPRTSGDSVDSYFRQIASAPLLTREGETVLARKIESYERFAGDYPGYGGFLPWIAVGADGSITPADGWWEHNLPLLDNAHTI